MKGKEKYQKDRLIKLKSRSSRVYYGLQVNLDETIQVINNDKPLNELAQKMSKFNRSK
jgi:hypothetical protein